ncbi:AI-2E family transporter [Lactococcus formosensis]|uniref:AI-2E family transporter n=1 Tax=Lactococcus formosensis TaxID=1281486 RepID=A0A9X4SD42_9LACT|nr:AI-2E family transporter [Lactococcus formosensis]MCO7180185.1 AI-2E family transporter [Lactococcus formosensis]MDG6111087.1 AI-2E family transporter [Lactococcus formosensis]MDG6117305.1 AI-2E family transporter [Lactococcus formosensis]MDG6132762.1 AI-2E family transporter [Lactococcus formosensis]MDG6134757.1 AI-2E family transporter [Lactococcus formosensis]
MGKIKINFNLWLNGLLFFVVLFLLFNVISNITPITKSIANFLQILSPLFLGAIVAYFLDKPIHRLSLLFRRLNVKFVQRHARKFSILVTYIIFFLLLFFVIYYLFPIVVRNLLEFLRLLPTIYQNIYQWLSSNQFQELDNFLQIEESIRSFVNAFSAQDAARYITSGIESLSTFTFTLASQLFRIVVGIIISIYLLLYKESILQIIFRFGKISAKQEHLQAIKYYLRQTDIIFYKFISTQFIDACIMWVLSTLLLLLLHVTGVAHNPFSVALGLLIGICNMIPYFGSIFASIVAMIIAFFTGGWEAGLVTIVMLIILQQIDGNIIGPKLMSGALNVNPIIVIISISIGGAYFGVIGMFVAVPIAALLKIIFIEYLEAKESKLSLAQQGK